MMPWCRSVAAGLACLILFIPVRGNGADATPMPDPFADASGRELMDVVYARHRQYPYVYEEQSMVLVDRNDRRQTRTLRRYSRVAEDGTVRFLLLFDSPDDVAGVAMLAQRDPDGAITQSVYLPAFDGALVRSASDCEVACGDNFLGSDFTVESLTGEILDDYAYHRGGDVQLGDLSFYVIDVTRPGQSRVLRRHYVSSRNLFIERTDYLDDLGHLRKRQTQHDLARIHGDMWRANMLLMENRLEQHRSIIRIDRRVFSADYVPEHVFTHDWLLANEPPVPRAEEKTPAKTDAEVDA